MTRDINSHFPNRTLRFSDLDTYEFHCVLDRKNAERPNFGRPYDYCLIVPTKLGRCILYGVGDINLQGYVLPEVEGILNKIVAEAKDPVTGVPRITDEIRHPEKLTLKGKIQRKKIGTIVAKDISLKIN